MKVFINISVFALTVIMSYGQTKTVDSLIQAINNDQLYGTCHYFWFVEMESTAGDSLIKIGKLATNQLIEYLDDKDKGIIVHYILSNIWYKRITFSSSFENYDESGIIEYSYCDLVFYQNGETTYTEFEKLTENKRKWMDKYEK